jgi:ribosomal protein L31
MSTNSFHTESHHAREADQHGLAPCPNCRQPMGAHRLPAHYGKQLSIDTCSSCHLFWFDQGESTRLSADGVIELFKLINTSKGVQTPQLARRLTCVRCPKPLLRTVDKVKTGSFNYFACGDGHGRLTSFYHFLIEKRFVRSLSKIEIERLAIEVKQVSCSGCGAPVNLSKDTACSYCQSPISVFDRDAAQKAIDHYLREHKRTLPSAPAPNQEGAPASVQGVDNHRATASLLEGVDLALDVAWAISRLVGSAKRQSAVTDFGSMLGATARSDSLPDSQYLADSASAADAVSGLIDVAAVETDSLIDLVGEGIGSFLAGLS